MEKIENGLFVSVDYKGTLENGDVFDSSFDRQPLEVQMGAGQLIKGFEDALKGMTLNEKKTFSLTPEEAYGNRNEQLVHHFSRKDIPSDMNPRIGDTVALTAENGQQTPARIIEVTDENISVDLNHPLAGESLTFEIEIKGISKTATQQHGCGCGHGHGGCGHDHDECGHDHDGCGHDHGGCSGGC